MRRRSSERDIGGSGSGNARLIMADKVLMIGPSTEAWGGIATVEKNIIQAAAMAGRPIRFVPTMRDGSKIGKIIFFAGAYIRIALYDLNRCDVCHIHMALGMSYRRKYLICRIADMRGIPYILHVHEGDFENLYEAMQTSEQRKVRWMLKSASSVIALSDEWKEYLVRKFDLNNVVVLENAVFVPNINDGSHDVSRFLFLGRLCYKKGLDTLLEATSILRKKYPGVEVNIAGGGDEIEGYRSLASKLGVEKNVCFLGWADEQEKRRLFSSCGTLVLPSRAEGLPMCVLEGMANGCAVIATRVGGIPSLIANGDNGLLIEPHNPERLANAMEYCIENPRQVSRIAQNGRQTIIRRYSMNTYLNKLDDIYETSVDVDERQ